MCCGSGGIPLNAVTTFKYLGQTRSVTDPLTNTVQHVYDVAGRLRQTIDPAPGATTKYDYDVFGNLNKTTDAIGKVSSATFNLRGFRTQMVDADAGTWNFSGDSLNELVGWSDANTNSFSQTFDALGRRTTRTEPEGTSTWVWGSTASMYNIGSLYQVYGLSAEEIYDYDSVGRLSDKTVIISGDQSYLFNYSYNSIGALDKVTYPTSPMPSGTGPRYEIEYAYSYGYPYQIQDITNSSSPVTIWTLGSVNDYFSPLTETIGWGSGAAAVTHSYLPSYNFVSTIQSGTGGSQTNMQNLAYSWDADGNLLQRQSLGTTLNPSTLTEHFTPDTLNRISSSTLNGATNLSMSYDAAGDILTKSDVGSYTYGNASHPHAVMGAGSNSYTYDANGNIKTRNGLANTWASFNLPTELQSSVSGTTLSTQFWYGPEHERVRQMATDLDGVESTYYVGDSLEKMIATTTNLTYWRHYVHTPYGLSIVVSRNSNLSSSASLVLDDHLGSSDAIVNDANGSLFVQESFDAFGQRRQSNWAAGVPSFWDQVAITEASRRGFTGHEQLDNVGLIHMNGRVYDPVIGRFLSVDPISGEPGDSQRLNPYAYVRNRPLTLTDPSGLDDRPLPPFSEDRLPYIVPGIIFIWGPTANQNDTSGPGNPVNPSAQSITQPQQPVNESNGQTTCCTYKPDSWISKDSFVNDDPGLHEIVVLAHKLVDFSVESWQGFARSGTIQRDEEGRRHFSLDNALFMASMMSLGTTTAAKSAIETVVADATATAAKQAAETAAGQQLETVVVQAAKGLTNAEVRAIYAARVRLIDTSGPLTRATAERVHAARNALKVELRAMMANREEAAALEQTNPIQPFEFYVQKYTSEGLSGESLWQRIIQGGTTPNAAVNSRFGVP
jgi:RHS repeat-associated protein